MVIVNESGLYSLTLTSGKASAKRFKKWITGTVLPAIRKTGTYSTPDARPALTEEEKLAEAVLLAHEIMQQPSTLPSHS